MANEVLRSIVGNRYTWCAVGWFVGLRLAWEYGGEFGGHIIYATISLTILMCMNLGQRKPGEMSAYSMFNENYQTLPGSLTAAQIDQGFRNGPSPFASEGQQQQQQQEQGERDAAEIDDEEEMIQLAIARSLEDQGGGGGPSGKKISQKRLKKNIKKKQKVR